MAPVDLLLRSLVRRESSNSLVLYQSKSPRHQHSSSDPSDQVFRLMTCWRKHLQASIGVHPSGIGVPTKSRRIEHPSVAREPELDEPLAVKIPAPSPPRSRSGVGCSRSGRRMRKGPLQSCFAFRRSGAIEGEPFEHSPDRQRRLRPDKPRSLDVGRKVGAMKPWSEIV